MGTVRAGFLGGLVVVTVAVFAWALTPRAHERRAPRVVPTAAPSIVTAPVRVADGLVLRRALAIRRVLFTRWLAAVSATSPRGPRSGGVDRGTVEPTGACGGDLPPCYVMWRESRDEPGAVNPCDCAFGKWQFQQPTWDTVARESGRSDLVGVRASSVDVGTQDAMARALWAHGAGCGNWSACA
jgi:hypothetical protein